MSRNNAKKAYSYYKKISSNSLKMKNKNIFNFNTVATLFISILALLISIGSYQILKNQYYIDNTRIINEVNDRRPYFVYGRQIDVKKLYDKETYYSEYIINTGAPVKQSSLFIDRYCKIEGTYNDGTVRTAYFQVCNNFADMMENHSNIESYLYKGDKNILYYQEYENEGYVFLNDFLLYFIMSDDSLSETFDEITGLKVQFTAQLYNFCHITYIDSNNIKYNELLSLDETDMYNINRISEYKKIKEFMHSNSNNFILHAYEDAISFNNDQYDKLLRDLSSFMYKNFYKPFLK